VIGAVLAVVVAVSVVSQETSAPGTNPAGQDIVQYGTR